MARMIGIVLSGVLTITACGKEGPPEHHRKKIAELSEPAGVDVDSAKLSMFGALPTTFESKDKPSNDDVVALGQVLFHDERLSKTGKLSCDGCHSLGKFGADGDDFSTGATGRKEPRNSPTVLNAAGQLAQFWDGRAQSVEDAAKAHLLNPNEMAMPDESHVVGALKATYAAAFKTAFPDQEDAMTFANVLIALGSFERKLVTPSKWDAFLKGDKRAVADDEKKGFLKFVDVGCPTCHVGPLVGGTMFQKLGKEKPWPNTADKGRSQVTKLPSDYMMFKVAQLRNVEHTGPYFHDASAKTLEEAVKTMASYQLNKELSDDDAKSIALWLKTLSGTLDPNLAKSPAIPASSGQAPKSGASPTKK